MSGAAGGSRISKENLKDTIRDYRENVLKPLGLDKSYSITGVRSRPEKNTFGDIDIVLSYPSGEEPELKKQLAQYISSIDFIPTIPSKNAKYFIHGSIVSILYPIIGRENEFVQIDNIVTVTKEGGKFAYKMLDLPAEIQILVLSLVKTVFTELKEPEIEKLFSNLNIPENIKKPNENEEYEFNINPSKELSLRIVPGYLLKGKTEEVWKSKNYEDVKKILLALGIDIEKDKKEDKFTSIINKIKTFDKKRSIPRIKGMFNSDILRVGDTEKGTEKGIEKQQAMDTVAALQEKYSALVMELINPFLLEDKSEKIIAVFPGKFKPPHKDHIARIKAAANDADEVIVLISPKTEPGGEPKTKKEIEKLTTRLKDEMHITSDQSLAIFKAANLPKKVTVMRSDDPRLPVPHESPVTAAHKIFEANPEQRYIAVFGKGEDLGRFGKVPQNTTIKNYANSAGNLSATNLRIALKNGGNITPFLPDGISPEKYKQALKLPLNEWNDDDIKYWASHADLYKAMENNPDKEYKILKNKFKKRLDVIKEKENPDEKDEILKKTLEKRLDALNYFYHDFLSKDAPKKFSKDNAKIAENILLKNTSFQPLDFKTHLTSLTKYMVDQGMNIKPYPALKIINNDFKNAENMLGKTAYYDPTNCSITLYTLNRHPKDILRSYAHEMIHRMQDNEGRLKNITTTNTNEDGDLEELEKEAYLKGNICFRNWEDTIKTPLNEWVANILKYKHLKL